MSFDWADGRYETTADQLHPAAVAAVAACTVRPGEAVLDVGAGTGNAALLAAAAGARSVAVDPAARLLAVAKARAATAGFDVETRAGEAAELPAATGEFDAAISVFGVIFAADGPRSVAELVRVVRPGGRIVLTTWAPQGAIGAVGAILRREMAAALGPAPQRTNWSDPAVVDELFAPHPVTLNVTEATLVFRATDAEAWFDQNEAEHPVWRSGRRLLDDAAWKRVRSASLEALRGGNEGRDGGFVTTSRYRIVRVDLRP